MMEGTGGERPESLEPQFMLLLNNSSRKNCPVGRVVQMRQLLGFPSLCGLPCVKDWSMQGSTGTNELQATRLIPDFVLFGF